MIATKTPPLLQHSQDRFLGGRVTLVQPLRGHRAGLDAALLQALVPADAAGQAVDLGAGAGTVALALAARCPALNVTGIEREAELVACGGAALRLPENAGFAGRVRLIQAEIDAVRGGLADPGLADRSADWVLMNPPFDLPGRVRASPDVLRRSAHLAGHGLLDAWCRVAARMCRPGGQLCLIHRAGALPDVLAATARRFGDIRVMPVHPSGEGPASRILVRGTRGSRAGLSILPGLVLHMADGGWTPKVAAVLEGGIALPL